MSKKKEIKKLRKKLQKNVDRLLKSLVEVKTKELNSLNFDIKIEEVNLIEDANEMVELLYNNKENTKKLNGELYLSKKVFELLIYEYFVLQYLISQPTWQEKIKIDLTSETKIRLNNFLLLLNNQINGLKSILLLLEKGLTQSSDVLFRNFMETSEKGLAILIDDEYYKAYTTQTTSHEESLEIWNKTKPSKTCKIIERRFKNLDKNQFYETFFKLRKDFYSQTSKAVHAELHSTVTQSLNFNKNDTVNLSFGGKEDDMVNQAFQNYILYIKTMSQKMLIVLVSDYKLNMNKFGEDGMHYTLVYKVTEEAFKLCLK
ncbi:hypothetical protein [Ochrovirga pacifica]|uniref:hypothetical protein n=1 Tax=Ochrovirga pacifica TaxID=1042376 RepID=UPI000255A2C1|nr:hypothetical protein [Ochrovirga pacifica]